ncbi:hypothetical protein HS088_TW02G00377 [Tripterygium wilfordii]|uniref:Clp R domain-containing protein n=1 Tax=Tripterygium wilfordii TaxID=458696 RepID=A0A7J7DYV0_TRIWF|nr:protein SMAX1-LIKE 6-like [Tripterygium wilfordii]KAF5751364.1 hypothetical protein HS088_TW02G00377 [Tripterygium wilfordii]
MPTPVAAARQCLTEDAARALDDAVGVARRRSHAQTTSLHAVSALLAMPNSILRDACTRASCFFSRNQFQALGASVGFSLDKLPSAKALEEPPPVSNSLMAAIKRSQANKRRNPDIFYLQQIHSNNQTPSLLKVELKHFLLSILDDPIVGRVFGEAGFGSCDIKTAILSPPVTQTASSRILKTRLQTMFLGNVIDSDAGRSGFGFPSANPLAYNCKRIVEVLVKKKGRNPLLVGVCAGDALKSFVEHLVRGNGSILPVEIAKLRVICVESEIREFVLQRGSEEKMGFTFEELKTELEHCSGPASGVMVNLGELGALTGNGTSSDALRYIVSKVTGLLEMYGDKLWLIGAAASDDTIRSELFLAIEKDWDLHPLPISSSRNLIEEVCSKSSFVPLAGFFNPPPSDFGIRSMCHLCTAKYQQEVAILRSRSTFTVPDHHSKNLPYFLQVENLDTTKGLQAAKSLQTKDDGTTLNAKILALHKRWSDICRHNHHAQSFHIPNVPDAKSQVPVIEDNRFSTNTKLGYGKDSSVFDSQCAHLSPTMHTDSQNLSPSKQNMPAPVVSEAGIIGIQSKLQLPVSRSHRTETEDSQLSSTSVTTDLGLGTMCASSSQEANNTKLQDHRQRLQHFPSSISTKFDVVIENTSRHIVPSSSCSGPAWGKQFDMRDKESLKRVLTEKVGWQVPAICSIAQAISRYQAGYGSCGSNPGENTWFTFLGSDKVGKRKVASTLAEVIFGSKKNLISVDFGSEDGVSQLYLVFDCLELNGDNAVNFIGGELRKKPHSVIFLENVDNADPQVQKCLSQAINTGKFPDKSGSVDANQLIFVTTSMGTEGEKDFHVKNDRFKFSEEMILAAKCWQMKILIECAAGDSSKGNTINVGITSKLATSTSSSLNKRKLIDTSESMEMEMNLEIQKRSPKTFRSDFDLNLPADQPELWYRESERWLEDFLDQVDERVFFEPFGFDEQAEKLQKDINMLAQRTFGSNAVLEIDDGVMVQMLAATWLSDNVNDVDDWVERVVGRGFAEAKQKYPLAAGSVVKLVSCDGILVEVEAPGLHLPERIILN